MNSVVKDLKDKFIKDNDLLFEKVQVSKEENKELQKNYDSSSIHEQEKMGEEYLIEDEIGGIKIDGKKVFYKKRLINITDEEIKDIININSYKFIKETNENISTIKNIVIFWCALTIISLIVGIFIALNIYGH
ncbi:UNVERIFIED_CONTAM: hypothetical protein Cloal_0443 [Acetivibrio alkalicellulosi]